VENDVDRKQICNNSHLQVEVLVEHIVQWESHFVDVWSRISNNLALVWSVCWKGLVCITSWQ